MARLNAKWNNFRKRGQKWDHFWMDAFLTSSVTLSNVGNIASAEAFGTPSIIEVATGVGGIASAEAFGTPSITLVINAVGIPSAEVFGIPTLSGSGIPVIVPGGGGVESGGGGYNYDDIFRRKPIPVNQDVYRRKPAPAVLRRKREEEEILIL